MPAYFIKGLREKRMSYLAKTVLSKVFSIVSIISTGKIIESSLYKLI